MSSTTDRTLNLHNVREYLIHNNGTVRQSDLLSHFRDLTNNNETIKAKARQDLKQILNLISKLKEENGTKYVCLVEQYALKQQPLQQQQQQQQKQQQQQQPSPPSKTNKEITNNNLRPSTPSPQDRRKSVQVGKDIRYRRLSAIAGLKKDFQVNSGPPSPQNPTCPGLATTDEDEEEEEIRKEEVDWMQACCHGNIKKLQRSLRAHPNLLHHRDFVLGYTLLHWAAKLDRPDIVDFVAAHRTDTDYLDVKSHGGYTALHIGAMCGKESVVVKLLDLGASVHARNHDGMKPKDVVKESVSVGVQNRLGRLVVGTERCATLSVSKRFDSPKLARSSAV